MKKSKTILLFSIVFTIITFLYTVLKVNTIPHSIYKEGNYIVKGIIKKCNISEDKTTITLSNKEDILITDYNKSNCYIGSTIKVTGTLKKPNNNTLFNTFNYRKYLYSQNISYIMTSEKITILSTETNTFYSIQNFIRNHIQKYKTKDYLEAFILGDKNNIDEDVMNSFQNNGISHLLSISGMHISLLSLIILFLLNKISKRKLFNYFLVIICLIFYALLTGLSPSVVRATLLFIALTINKVFNLKIKTIYLLIIICDLALINNPYIIYNVGFQFSYIVSFYLILFQKLINKKNNYITKTFIISFISFLAGLPIMIINFHQINFLSPLINVLFVPLVSIIVFPFSLITLFIPFFDIPLKLLIDLMEKISLNISTIDSFVIVFRHINTHIFIFYYILITYSLYCLLIKQINGLILLFITFVIHANFNYLTENGYITMLDVGQGDSILIVLPHKKGNILIDTGGKLDFNNKTKTTTQINNSISYFKSEGINVINYLILTHGDYDHMGESINLVNNFKVENVIFNCGSFNDLEKELITVLDNKKIKYYTCIKKLNIDKYKLQFLNTGIYDDENTGSSVLYFNYNNKKFLFMADASKEREKDILKNYNLKDIDFLKVGHHGSNTSSSNKFISSINPKYSLISVGKNNMYGHPKETVLDILKNSKIYRTDKDGSIKIKLNKNGYKIRTCSS